MSAPTYIVFNSAMAAAAAPVAQPTGVATIRTHLQLCFATGVIARIIEWGCSFDGAPATAVPGKVELVECNVAATMSTAYAAADIQLHNDANAPVNSTGASGVPLNLSTTTSGFGTGAVTEGSVTVTRMADAQLVAPTNQYWKQWPKDREFEVTPQKFLRIRSTFPVAVNLIAYVVFEV